MPYIALPGLEGLHWRHVSAEEGPHAMNAGLRECLQQTKTAASMMAFAAGSCLEKFRENPDAESFFEAFSAAVAELDTAVARTIRQWREIAGQRPTHYGLPNEDGVIPHTTVDQAVEEILDQWPDFDYPETLDIVQYRPIVIEAPKNRNTLEFCIEGFNEENQGEDGQGGIDKPSENLLNAEARFIESVLLEYRGYWLDPGPTIRVAVRRWQSRHRPDMFRRRNFTTALCGHCRRPAGAETMKTCPNCLRRGCARCWLSRGGNSPTRDWTNCYAKTMERRNREYMESLPPTPPD